MSTKNKIAVIYFSRSAKSEARHKKWSDFSSKSQRTSISMFLHAQTENLLETLDLDILCFNEENQVGSTFGEKIANAFKTTFDLGYESAISIGNDCINLSDIDFKCVENSLQRGSSILGPTFRKGAYLIGLSKEDFNFEHFQKLGWQTRNLQSDLEDYFDTYACKVAILATLRDINDLQDFSLVLENLKKTSRVAKQIFRLILAKNPINIFQIVSDFIIVFLDSHQHRGPPVYC